MKFIPTSREFNRLELIQSLQNTVRGIFAETDENTEYKSSIIGKITMKNDLSLNKYIQLKTNTGIGSNLRKQKRRTLINLSKDEEIIILPADKDGKVVIYNYDDYIKEGYRQLNTETYEEIDRDRFESIIIKVNEKITTSFTGKESNPFAEVLRIHPNGPTKYSHSIATEVTGDPVAVRKCISLCTERPSANMTCNFHVLGTPIGDDIFVNSHLHEQAFPKLKQAIDAVSSLPDPQIAYLLLRHCVAGPKINHFNRTIPPLVMESFLHRFDQEVMQAFEQITATQLNEATRQQVALPLNLGGLGLRSGEKHSFCAYISSILSVARNGSRDPRDIEDMVDKELSTFKEKLTDREDSEMIHLTTDVFLTAEELENVNESSIPKDLSIPSKKQQQEGLNQGYSEGSPLNMAKCVDDLAISHPSPNHLVLTEEFYSRNNGHYSDAESQHAPSKRIVSQSHSRPIGFPNIGNSCFLNAIMRSLFCLDMFMIHVRTQHAFSEILNCIRKKRESIDNQPFDVTRFTVKAIRKRNRQYRTVTHPPTDIENRVVTFLGHMNCLADVLEHANSKQGTVKRALRGILDLTPLEKLRQHDAHEMLLSIFDLLPGCDDLFSFTVCNTLRCTHCDAVTR
ncbi:hypothetical protein GJ496_002748 [Pomphorhynchus laevis]|nr:hypothetical protein GJ496_002748 [Pomphorhynchus laevis]